MRRFDDCLCGTTTTGTGTLSLAAIPSGAGGGIDPDVWARTSTVGFASSAAFLIDYVITEYTDSTFSTEKNKEAGIGTLTLGSSSGIANATLARTTISWIATSLNSQPASVTVAGSAISIGTAANTIVMCTPLTESLLSVQPYIDSSANGGYSFPVSLGQIGTATQGMGALSAGLMYYVPFWWGSAKSISKCQVKTGSTAASDSSNSLNAALYDYGTNGRASKKLLDFGAFAGTNIFNTASNAVVATAAGSYAIIPGPYVLGFLITRSSPSGTASLNGQSFVLPNAPAYDGYRDPANGAYSSETLSGGLMPDPPSYASYNLTNSNNGLPIAFGLL
jgi:hypothetical protein